jgi:uncharacterized delta-60 repeat protein/RHS repeat-associated protein
MGSSHKNQFASAVRHFVRSKTNRSNRSQKALNGAIFETLEGRRLFSTGTFTVTNPSADGTGTLGWAIGQADVDTVDSTVNIDFDTSLTEHGAANVSIDGDIGIGNSTAQIDVNGPGADLLSVLQTSEGGFLTVSYGSNVQIQGLNVETTEAGGQAVLANNGSLAVVECTISGNASPGITNQGTLNVTSSTISNNYNSYGAGGGINNLGTLTITDSTISGNSTVGNGGGIYNGEYAVSTVVGSTISGNSAIGKGGGIYNGWGSTSTVTSSTISGNTANGQGGGIYSSRSSGYSNTVVTDSTISGNSSWSGSGIYSDNQATLNGTIVAGNIGSDDLDVSSVAGSYSLIGSFEPGSNIYSLTSSDIGTESSPINPELSTLGNYGGLTQTMVPLAGSPALGAGYAFEGISSDQRGFPLADDPSPDIGAFQTQSSPLQVDTTADDPVSEGDLSLRDAVNLANALGGAQTVSLSAVGGTANIDDNATPVAPGSSVTVDGSVTVNSGGILGGTGTIDGSVNVESGGTLAPGDGSSGTGTLDTGDVNLNPGSNLDATVNGSGSGDYDQVVSSGEIDINQSLLSINDTGSVADDASMSVLQSSTGDLSGSFSNLNDDEVFTADGVNYYGDYSDGQVNAVEIPYSLPTNLYGQEFTYLIYHPPGPYSGYHSPGSFSTVTYSDCDCDPLAFLGDSSTDTPALQSDMGGAIYTAAEALENGPDADMSGTGSDGGNNTVAMDVPHLTSTEPDGGGSIVAVNGPSSETWFDPDESGYTARYGSGASLTSDGSEMILTEADGTQWTFNELGTGSSSDGQPISETDPGSGVTTDFSYNGGGQVTDVTRSLTVGSTVTEEEFVYSYLSSGVNSGKISSIELERSTFSSGSSPSSWSPVQSVVYSYYTGSSGQYGGNVGDLEYVTLYDGAPTTGTALGTSYYRYTTISTDVDQTQDLVEYSFDAQSYARLLAALPSGESPDSLTDSELQSGGFAAYADTYNTYDSQGQIATQYIQGRGTTTYTFTLNPSAPSTPSYSVWAKETTIENPDGSFDYQYFNGYGEQLLDIAQDVSAGSTTTYLGTFREYDGSGLPTLVASPSAVVLPSPSETPVPGVDPWSGIEGSGGGLLGVGGLSLSTTSGLITTTTYTTTSDVPGEQEASTSVQQGTTGTSILQESWTYVGQTAVSGGPAVAFVQTDTTYGLTGGGDPRTTTYTYSNWSGFQPEVVTTSLPIISTSQNGPGGTSASTEVDYYNPEGQLIWQVDPNGNISYTGYDPATGAVVQSIQDVNPASTSITFEDLNSALPTPTSTHSSFLNLITSITVDNQGRTTKEITPAGNITYFVYNDAYTDSSGAEVRYEVRTYTGWTGSAETGPTQITREVWPAPASGNELFTETLTTDDTPSTTSGVPNGSESITGSGIQSLTRDLTNSQGQVVEEDKYFTLAGITYTLGSVWLGLGSNSSAVGNYYSTSYGYDVDGRENSVEDPTGTITQTTFNSLGWAMNQSIGTASSNMVQVSASTYDSDGNLTQTTTYPGGSNTSIASRVTTYAYNFQNQLILEIDGYGSSQPIVTATSYDNANEVTEVQQYAGNGFNSSGGVPTGDSSLLRAQTDYFYDDQGQNYQTSTFSVAPVTTNVSAGTVNYTNPIDTFNYFDADGNLIDTVSPTGMSTKYAYDGADRNTFAYVTDGGLFNNFSNVSIGSASAYSFAYNVSNDVVLTQTQYVYDADSNVIESITSDRFGTDANSSTGALGTPSTAPYARVSYTASYFDAADRDISDVNVGTYGGSAWSRPSNVPSGSATVLVTSTTYNPAGWVGTTTDPKGIVAETLYNLAGQTTQTVANFNAGSSTITDSMNQTTSYVYDGDGHVLVMTANMPSGEITQVTHYVYGVTTGQGSYIDDNDLLYQVQYPDPTSGTNTSTGTYNQSEGYTYDALGEQLTYTDRNGTKHQYSYDALGRMTADNITNFGSGVDQTVSEMGYAYNDAGQLFTATSFNSTGGVVNQVQMTYDGLGNPLTDAQSNSGNVSGGTPTVSYTYDITNSYRLSSIAYPDGRVIDYNYNGNGGLDTILSRISNLSSGSTTLQSYTYLGLDTPVTFNNGNGVYLSYLGTIGSTGGDAGDQYTGLDRFGRIINQNWSSGSSTGSIDDFQYGYDADGNVFYMNNATNTSSGTTNTTLAGESQLYTYDSLNRLTNFSSGTLSISGGVASISGTASNTEGWNLDAVGNWKNSSSGGITTNRNNSGQNQVLSVGSATLSYDLNGNTLTDQNGQTYVYDAWNRVVKVTGANGTVLAQYSYDAEGRRITETQGSAAGGGTTTDLYYSDRDQVVQENVGTLVTAEHVWNPFYVNAMIETVTNPQVTTSQSNGSVDATFGTNTSNSTTTTSIGASFGNVESAADGTGLVVVTNTSSGLSVLFYNASGGLVSSESDTTLSGLSPDAVLVQPNGYIDVAVTSSSAGMKVVQLNSDGTVNTSFGTSGVKSVAITGTVTTECIALAANGDILVAGMSSTACTVAEVNSSGGSLVTSFGSSGTKTLADSSTHLVALAGLVVEPDGVIVFGGYYANVSGGKPVTGVELIALTPNGSTYIPFGHLGYEIDTTHFNGTDLSPLAVTATGDILVGSVYGDGGGGNAGFNLEEFNPGGTVNTSFGTNGVASAPVLAGPLDSYALPTLAIEPDGQIVVGGQGTDYTGSGATAFYLARFNADGSLDTTFGTSGIVTVTGMEYGDAMTMMASGKTVLIGQASSSSTGIILQQFNTLAKSQILYPTYNADYSVTSLTNSSGTVVERYSYDPYGNVTVLNPNGTVRGDGNAAGSFYGSVYLYQGMRFELSIGLYDAMKRQTYDPSLGKFLQQDPKRYVNGPNVYQFVLSNPINHSDPTGLSSDDDGWSWSDVGEALLVGALVVGAVVAAPAVVGALAVAAGADVVTAAVASTATALIIDNVAPAATVVGTALYLDAAATGRNLNGTPLTTRQQIWMAGMAVGGTAASYLCPLSFCFVAGTRVLLVPAENEILAASDEAVQLKEVFLKEISQALICAAPVAYFVCVYFERQRFLRMAKRSRDETKPLVFPLWPSGPLLREAGDHHRSDFMFGERLILI